MEHRQMDTGKRSLLPGSRWDDACCLSLSPFPHLCATCLPNQPMESYSGPPAPPPPGPPPQAFCLDTVPRAWSLTWIPGGTC